MGFIWFLLGLITVPATATGILLIYGALIKLGKESVDNITTRCTERVAPENRSYRDAFDKGWNMGWKQAMEWKEEEYADVRENREETDQGCEGGDDGETAD